MSPRKTIELGPEGRRYRIYDPGGGGRVAKILRKGIPYEVDVVEDMATLEPKGTALDVGANIGNHVLWLAAVCGLRVEAFEPIKYAKCQRNVDLNPEIVDQVTVHPFALGQSTGSAHLIGKNRLEAGEGDFEVRTLDEFEIRDVSILKIDVEGMETDVIQGGLATIERERPVIYAEAWDEEYRQATARLLEPLGYTHGRKFRWHQHRWDP